MFFYLAIYTICSIKYNSMNNYPITFDKFFNALLIKNDQHRLYPEKFH